MSLRKYTLKKASKKVHVLTRITPYMSISKRKLQMNSFLLHNLAIVHLIGCAIAVQWITRLFVCMKGASALYTVTRHHLLKNC